MTQRYAPLTGNRWKAPRLDGRKNITGVRQRFLFRGVGRGGLHLLEGIQLQLEMRGDFLELLGLVKLHLRQFLPGGFQIRRRTAVLRLDDLLPGGIDLRLHFGAGLGALIQKILMNNAVGILR